jgi:hypothetical protein
MADLRSIPQRLQIPIPSGGSRAPSLEISSIKATTTPLIEKLYRAAMSYRDLYENGLEPMF